LEHRRVSDTDDAASLDLYTELAAISDAPNDDQAGRARELIRRVSGLSAGQLQEWRDALRQVVPSITKSDFDAIVREERRAQKVKARDAAASKRRSRLDDERAATGGLLLASPYDPMPVARALTGRLPSTSGVPHLRWWRGDFYQWDGTRWVVQQDSTIAKWLYTETENALCELDGEIVRWSPTASKIGTLIDALGKAVVARRWEDEDVRCIAVGNGILEVLADGERKLMPHDPRRFNLSALPFDYDPDAECPRWCAFLSEVLPGDEEAHGFLGEWLGYLVSGRTDQQKIAHLYGARRSGKGTIGRVTEALLGPSSVSSPTLRSLIGQFGEAPLIGKTLAILSDINWSMRDISDAVEVLKSISGEDSRDIDRKNRESWHGKLGVRFMILGNDEPKFTDASGALAGRMIHLKFSTSFYGREDPGLTDHLLAELPGILNWSLDGLDRLNKRGRFKPPASSKAAEREVLRGTSPVYGFIDDRAVMARNADPVPLNDVYGAYREWCQLQGLERVITRDVFSRYLRSFGNGAIEVQRQMAEGVREQRVHGLAPQYPGALTPRQQWLAGR
jgi:putative DNA primase/helicase